MTITLDLPADLEAALRADAQAQGLPTETVAAERLAAFYEYESAESEPEAVEAIAQAFANLDAGEQGMPIEEYVADVTERRRRRDAAKNSDA